MILSEPLVWSVALAERSSYSTFSILFSRTSLLAIPDRAVPDWLRCVHYVPPVTALASSVILFVSRQC